MQSALSVEDRIAKTWAMHWGVLKYQFLYFFETAEAALPLKLVVLKECVVRAAPEREQPFCFVIRHQHDKWPPYYFSVANEKSLKLWLNYLELTVRREVDHSHEDVSPSLPHKLARRVSMSSSFSTTPSPRVKYTGAVLDALESGRSGGATRHSGEMTPLPNSLPVVHGSLELARDRMGSSHEDVGYSHFPSSLN